MKLTVHFETLGCKLNQVETEGMASYFNKTGFSVSMTPVTAETECNNNVILAVINTCTVTAKAEQKARRIIRLLLLKFPQAAVLVTGCYAQNNPEEISKLDKRVCVLGGQLKGKISYLPEFILAQKELIGCELAEKINNFFIGKYISLSNNSAVEPFSLVPADFLHHSRASVKIQDGCNCICTYCAIRIARGKSVSLDAGKVIEQIKNIEKSGYNEVVITTVNIAQYESVWNGKKILFAGLLKLILQNTSGIRIRISSLYPEIVNEELGEILADSRICPHFHLSVQSGSDKILAKMKRPYKIQAVYDACRILKKVKENPFLACDIITGFPGETDEDFNLTLKMLDDCGFSFVHAFPFSARKGTEAYNMRPMVPNSISKKRVAALEEFNKSAKEKYYSYFFGKTLYGILENVHKPNLLLKNNIVHVVTDNFLHCRIPVLNGQNVPSPGSLVKVKIISSLLGKENAGEWDLQGELV